MTRDERQKIGILNWVKAQCRGTLVWATGVGKTLTGIKAIKLYLTKNKDKNIVVIVPTENLKIQWLQSLSKNGLYHEVKVEIINSAIKRDDLINLAILDECHRYASDEFYQFFDKRNPERILGLSATFDRLDNKQELLLKYCPPVDYISVQEAIENKWLSPYKEYKVLLEVDDLDEYKRHNADFINAFSFFEFNFELAMACVTNVRYRRAYAKKMKIPHTEVDGITFTWLRALKARKSFVMEHPKKIEITRKILCARQNKKSLTFSPTIKMAEKIGIGSVIHSKNTKKKNSILLDDFKKVNVGNANTAKSLDEGTDIPGLNLAVILSNSSSKTQKTQRLGRIIRYEEGKEAELFTLVIKGTMEENWYGTSSAGKNYIEISEEELEKVLNYNPIDEYVKQAVASDTLFRL